MKNNGLFFFTYSIEDAIKASENQSVIFVKEKDYFATLNRIFKEDFVKHIINRRIKPVWKKTLSVIMFCSFFTLSFFIIPKIGNTMYVSLSILKLALLIYKNSIKQNIPKEKENIKSSKISKTQLPIYTIFLPLYKENTVVEQLIKSIDLIDYPKKLLDVKIITEEGDKMTAEALSKIKIPEHFSIVEIPFKNPLTKPKALNYAMLFCVGQYFTIYDAEDIMETKQIYKNLDMFLEKNGSIFPDKPKYVAIQSRLLFYNTEKNFFGLMLDIEYHTLFSNMLPIASRFSSFLPLGGTSNHCITDAVNKIGNWDSYNVVEDFELSMRIYESGSEIKFVDSFTAEGAVTNFTDWYKQRTRWIKGFIISIASSFPFFEIRLLKEPIKLIGFLILGWFAIIYPITYLMFIYYLLTLKFGIAAIYFISFVVWSIISVLTYKRKSKNKKYQIILSFFIYNLLIVIPFIRAVYQIIKSRSLWEKTPHTELAKTTNFEDE